MRASASPAELAKRLRVLLAAGACRHSHRRRHPDRIDALMADAGFELRPDAPSDQKDRSRDRA